MKAKKLRKMYSVGLQTKVADYSRPYGVHKAARNFKYDIVMLSGG